MDYRKLTTNVNGTTEKDKLIYKETIKANVGLLGLHDMHFKSLMIGKTKERLT